MVAALQIALAVVSLVFAANAIRLSMGGRRHPYVKEALDEVDRRCDAIQMEVERNNAFIKRTQTR